MGPAIWGVGLCVPMAPLRHWSHPASVRPEGVEHADTQPAGSSETRFAAGLSGTILYYIILYYTILYWIRASPRRSPTAATSRAPTGGGTQPASEGVTCHC